MDREAHIFMTRFFLVLIVCLLILPIVVACQELTLAPAPVTDTTRTITAPNLGSAEHILKATGFSGEQTKAWLDELTLEAGSRVVATEGEHKALNWLENKYKAFGYTHMERQRFPTFIKDTFGQNLIVTRPGPSSKAPVLIFGGHYDTVGGTVGANDNGSGTAVTVELAQVLLNRFPDYELRFINFSGEEIGLMGSAYYVAQLSSEEKNRLVAYINIDNIGVGEQLIAAGHAPLVALTENIANRNGLRLVPLDLISKNKGSDHESFVKAGLKAVGLGRWLDSQMHLPGDIPQRVSPQALLAGGGLAILLAEALTAEVR